MRELGITYTKEEREHLLRQVKSQAGSASRPSAEDKLRARLSVSEAKRR